MKKERRGFGPVCVRTPMVNKAPLVNSIIKGVEPDSDECISHEEVEIRFPGRDDLAKMHRDLHMGDGMDENAWVRFVKDVIYWSKSSMDDRGKVLSAVLWEYGLMTDDYELFWQKTFDDLEKVRISTQMALRGSRPQ
jgi:hypothetical protein